MRVPRVECLPVRYRLLSTVLFSVVSILGSALSLWGQGSYRAQLRGVVSDATGAVVANATVTIRDVGTDIPTLRIRTTRDRISSPVCALPPTPSRLRPTAFVRRNEPEWFWRSIRSHR